MYSEFLDFSVPVTQSGGALRVCTDSCNAKFFLPLGCYFSVLAFDTEILNTRCVGHMGLFKDTDPVLSKLY